MQEIVDERPEPDEEPAGFPKSGPGDIFPTYTFEVSGDSPVPSQWDYKLNGIDIGSILSGFSLDFSAGDGLPLIWLRIIPKEGFKLKLPAKIAGELIQPEDQPQDGRPWRKGDRAKLTDVRGLPDGVTKYYFLVGEVTHTGIGTLAVTFDDGYTLTANENRFYASEDDSNE